MRIFRIRKELKDEFRLQRKIVFGNKRYWFHIAAWLMVGVLLIYTDNTADFTDGIKTGFVRIKTGEKVSINTSVLLYSIGAGVLLAALMTYFFLLWVIPLARYRRQKRVLWLGLLLNIFIYLVVIIVLGIIAGYTSVGNDKEDARMFIGLGIVAIMSAIFCSYFFSIYYFIDLYDQQKELNRYQKVFADKLQAESNFLKTQINPHFLFNTLNNIYSLTLTKSGNAAQMTRRLKELLEYMLYDCVKDMVSLEGELAFLRNYVALEQLRNKQEHTDIRFNITGKPGALSIAPLLLINFIENAFKHGVKAGIEKAYVHINLYIMDNLLSVDIANSRPVPADKELAVTEAGGIGIRNVCRRLEILYPGTHKLRIVETKTDYTIHLNIEL